MNNIRFMKNFLLIISTVLILSFLCACGNENVGSAVSESAVKIKESTVKNFDKSEKSDNTFTVNIGDKSFSAQLYNNETAKAFADMLPLTLSMNELNGNEKYYNLKKPLPSDSSEVINIKSGDIMLYKSNCIVLFYDSFSTDYSYTKIGYIENPSELADAVGSDDITITFNK